MQKTHGNADEHPATIEMLCSPYMILKHDSFKLFDENTGKLKGENSEGYVIYYNRDGSTEYEFMYLFDYLSRFQILSSKAKIKLRIAHDNPNQDIKSNYKCAINTYAKAWNFDDYKKNELERIDFNVISKTVPNYSPGMLAWRFD